MTTAAGSLGYAAPEVLTGKGHGKPVDLWSIGIITFVLLCGYTPFRSDDQAELVRETTRGRLEFHERYWKNVSREAKEFISTLVQVDPTKRPTADEALKHPWLSLTETAADSEHHDLSTHVKQNYAATRKWRSAVRTIQATRRMQSQSNASSSANSSLAPSPTKQSAASAAAAEATTTDDEEGSFLTADEGESHGSHPHGLKRQGQEGGAMGERIDVKEGEQRGVAGAAEGDRGGIAGLVDKVKGAHI